jgi:hypothetical protein
MASAYSLRFERLFVEKEGPVDVVGSGPKYTVNRVGVSSSL